MRLKNILIVVKDIEHSKQFYHDLFGLNTILDNDGNVILTEGLVLQDEKIWKEVLNKDIIPENHVEKSNYNSHKWQRHKQQTHSIFSEYAVCF